MHRLQQAERLDRQGHLPNPTIRGLYKPVRENNHFFDGKPQFWVLANLEERLGQGRVTFTSYHELYRFLRMAFIVKNELCMVQQAIDIVLSKVKVQSAILYVEDVVIYSRAV